MLKTLKRYFLGLVGLWMGLGFPIACLVLLYADHHPWIGKYNSVMIAALVSVFGPLLIAGWMVRRWRKSQQQKPPARGSPP
jgi:hypothetical protein